MIARLLLHFWTPQDLSAEARAAMAADWLGDLRGFSPEVFAEACSRWRIKETRRPTIAEMHKLCAEVRELRREPEQYLPPPLARFPSKPHHQFLRNKIRVNGPERGPGYFALTDHEKWQYHAYDYAFRRLALHDENSPIDPDRQWHDSALVEEAMGYFDGGAKARRDAKNQREGRAVMEDWARAKGYPSVDAYAGAKGIHWSDAYEEKIKENLAAVDARMQAMKRP